MSVILEFSIAAEEFHLGRVLSGPAGTAFELERIVPTGRAVMPLVWVTGDDAAVEAAVREHPSVAQLVVLDRLDRRSLYRIEWDESPADLAEAIRIGGGNVLRARGEDTWEFRVRFDDHGTLSAFHDDVTDRGLTVHVERTYTLGASEDDHRIGLTADQPEALLLALREGYFATPRETGLGDLADELGISRQALSNRIRRGNEKVLETALLQ